ncbi:hypothetical protein FOL47_006471 [Perkinsus chesapeaki]|uniref:Cysteine protease n=1 Tax=Perkinsus chesapeaki TaxID=330153 RepID=A0A7J6LRR4_PERCH|nr:hypothetical protein FOL47_006471 [Perkinsus chesapeaki]
MIKLALVAYLASCIVEYDVVESKNMFDDFKAKFSLDFGETDADREAIFSENVKYINEVNAKNLSYRLGINKFTHLTNEEFRDMMSLRGFMRTDAPGLRSHNKSSGGVFKFSGKPEDLPESVDWREKGYVTPVKNQGHCGSCWAFSTTGALEGLNKNMTGKLVSLSEQELLDCSRPLGNQGCKGGLMDKAFDYVELNGLESEDDYKYTGVDFSTCQSDKEKDVVKAHTISFQDVQPNSASSLLAALADNGPVSVCVDASDAVFQHYESGVITSGCGTRLDHGVLAVGYRRTAQNSRDNVPYFIVKNSWGDDWGDRGYLKIAIDGPEEGVCGILKKSSYPIKK